MKKKLTWATALALVLLGVVASINITVIASANYYNSRLLNLKERETTFAKFAEMKKFVEGYFVGKYDDQKLMDGAMDGYVKALDDQWSQYYTVDEFRLIKNNLNNEYVGIGINCTFNQKDETIIVSDVYKDSPADKAGIKPSDILEKVDGVDVSEIGYNGTVKILGGEANTTVKLSLVKGNSKEPYTAEVERQVLQIDAVETQILQENIGYVRIKNFNTNADKEFKEKLTNLINAGVKGIVFDVRFNAAGTTSSLLSIMDTLLPAGVMLTTQDKGGSGQEYKSDANQINLPMAVIINQYSYSTSEFFAAALQEYGKAVIIGEKTSGKGFAQEYKEFSDGSGISLSTNRYITPKGKSLSGVGITPDYQVGLDPALAYKFYSQTPEQDAQLSKALEVVKTEVAKVKAPAGK